MALNVNELRRAPEGMGAFYVSPARLCVTADDELVDCADPAAVRLLVGAGGELTRADAERYGLVSESADQVEAKTSSRSGGRRREADADEKQAELADNKERTGAEDKGS